MFDYIKIQKEAKGFFLNKTPVFKPFKLYLKFNLN